MSDNTDNQNTQEKPDLLNSETVLCRHCKVGVVEKGRCQSCGKINKGGAVPGAGRKPGQKSAATIERDEALRQFRERVAGNVHKLFNAQMDKAIGEKYLMCVRTIGKGAKARRETIIVEDVEIIKAYLDDTLDTGDDKYYFMTTKPADNHALDSLLNRAFGKPQESIDLTSKGDKINRPKIYLPEKLPESWATENAVDISPKK